VLQSFALFYGDFCKDLYSVDSDEAMKRGDEALKASSFLPNFHNVAHSGRLAYRSNVSSRFVWRGLSSDITAWTRECLYEDSPHHDIRNIPWCEDCCLLIRYSKYSLV
jgi:hypothetical protein